MRIHVKRRWRGPAVFLLAALGAAILFSQATIRANAAAGKVSADWPRWRGPNSDGISTETGWLAKWPKDGPKVLWTASVGVGHSAISVSGGRAYTMGNAGGKDTVFCFDAATGDQLWRYSYACPPGNYPGPRSTPTVDGDRVYTLSRQSQLFCLDAASGTVVWSKTQKDFGSKPGIWGYACSPLVVDDTLIVDVGVVAAFNKATGKLLWKVGKDKAGYSSPVLLTLGGREVLATFNAFGLVLRDPAQQGMELYRLRWETRYDVNAATPIVSGDRIFISSGYNTGAAVVRVGGERGVLWRNKEMRNHFGTCVLHEGYVYGFDAERFRCLDFNTGAVKWTQGGLGRGGVMLADGKLIIQADKGDLVIAEASPAGYREISRAKVLGGICWTYPVLCGGRIYCRNDKGNVVCLDVSGK